MQRFSHHGRQRVGGTIVALLVLSACGALPGPGGVPVALPIATAIPVIQQVMLDRAEVQPGEMDRLVVALHSPASGPVSAVTIVSYPDGTQVALQGRADGRPLEVQWTVPVDMGTGTARYDVVVSQVCGCGTATAATWGDAQGTFRITHSR